MAKKSTSKQRARPAALPPKVAPATAAHKEKGTAVAGVPAAPTRPGKRKDVPALAPKRAAVNQPPRLGHITAEMVAVGYGSRLCQSLLLALRHEGRPSHLSDERYLERFARYAWDKEEDEAAKSLMRLWQEQGSDDAVPDDDSAFTAAAEIAIATYQQQSEVIYDAMRNGDMTPAQARLALDHLRQQELATRAALSTLEDGSTADERVALLELVYGYNIANPNPGETFDDSQLEQLAYANLLMLQYLDTVMAGTNISALEAFRDGFATSPYSSAPGEQITVYLGEQGTAGAGGDFFGLVPLPGGAGYLGADPDTIPQAERDRFSAIYLGSEITTAAIIHEFFHQFDRRFTQGISQSNDFQGGVSFNEFLSPNLSIAIANDERNLVFEAESRANRINGQSQLPEEILADFGMTSVINWADITLFAFADEIGNPVQFADTNIARTMDCAFQQYLRNLLSTGSANEFDADLCS